MFALSVVAGVALFFLVAKVLFFGLMLLAPLALLAAMGFGIRRMALGYAPYHWNNRRHHPFQHWHGRMNEPLDHAPYRRAERLEDYRTIIVN